MGLIKRILGKANQEVIFNDMTSTAGANILARSNNTPYESGYKGNYLSSVASNAVSLVSGDINDCGCSPINLTPGTWDIQGICSFVPAGNCLIGKLYVFIGTAPGTSSAGLSGWNLFLTNYLSAVPGNELQHLTPLYRVVINSNTNYYVKSLVVFSGGGSLTAGGLLTARRI